MTAETAQRRGRGKQVVAVVLVVVSCVLAPLTVTAIWVRNQVLNTDRYVETVAPLATNPAIIEAAAASITETLFEHVDVEKEAREALPKRAKFLAGPLSVGIRGFTEQAATRILESDVFENLWNEANRLAHNQVESALTGGGKVLSTRNGRVTLDLSAVVTEVRKLLDDRGITIFDSIPINQLALKFELFDAAQLGDAQRGVKLLNALAWILPFVVFGLLGVAAWLSVNRRRTVIWWGIGAAIAMSLLGVGIVLGRSAYLHTVVSSSLPHDAAAATFDTLVRFLRQGLRFVLALGLLVALAAWVTGPSRFAVRLRTTFSEAFGGLGDQAEARGWDFGVFGTWVNRYRTALRVGGVLLMLLFLVFAYRPSATRLLVLTLLLLVYFAAVEFVSRAARDEPPAGPGAPAVERSPSGDRGSPELGGPKSR
jgi:hypothetical protein